MGFDAMLYQGGLNLGYLKKRERGHEVYGIKGYKTTLFHYLVRIGTLESVGFLLSQLRDSRILLMKASSC